MTTLKTLMVAGALLAIASPALACAPPEPGDRYELKGLIFEVVKAKNDCSDRICIRAPLSTRPCRWVNRIKDAPDAKWLILNGVPQDR